MIKALAGIFLLAATSVARAEDPISVGQFTCATVNCGGVTVQGRANANGTTSNPWVGQIWLAAGNLYCARLEIVKQSADLEMSIVAPDGTIYTSDNNGTVCPTCPKTVIKPVALRGAYTVVINTANGAAAEATFQLLAGQYKVANVNCGKATVPLSQKVSASEAAKMRKLGKN